MLVSTELLPYLGSCLDQVHKWNIIKLEFPYLFQNLQSASLQEEYKASSNVDPGLHINLRYTSRQCCLHIVIQLFGSLVLLYQVLFEDSSLSEISIHIHFAIFLLGCAILVGLQFRYAEKFANFINQILKLEMRRVVTSSKAEKEYWRRNVEYRKFVVFGLLLFRTVLPLVSFAIAASLAFNPYHPWRLIPQQILVQFDKITSCRWSFAYVVIEIIRRLLSFTYSFIVLRLLLNHCLIFLTLELTLAQTSLFWMLLAWKRSILSNFSIMGGVEVLDGITGWFRETQIFCNFYNCTYQRQVIPAIIILAVVGFTSSLFALVSAWDTLGFQTVVIFGDSVIGTGAVILLVFHLAIIINAESKNLCGFQFPLEQLNKSAVAKFKKSTLLRYWRSFPVLKIFFFESNYFESGTTLEILNFAINCSINLILLEQ